MSCHEIFMDKMSDENEAELDQILPRLIDAGYVEESRFSAGLLWAFTKAGVKRRKELGCE
jgi:hypothetical protein